MTTKTKTRPAGEKRTRQAMPAPASMKVVGSEDLEFLTTGPSSNYGEVYEKYQALKTTKGANTLLVAAPAGIEIKRYRDNLTAAFKKRLGGPCRGVVSFRLTTNGQLAIIKLGKGD